MPSPTITLTDIVAARERIRAIDLPHARARARKCCPA